MEHGFYADRLEQAAGFRPIVPQAADRETVHRVIFEELCAGRVLDSSRRELTAIVERGVAEGADSVILGCTEIVLSLDPNGLPCRASIPPRSTRRRRPGSRWRPKTSFANAWSLRPQSFDPIRPNACRTAPCAAFSPISERRSSWRIS